MEGLFEDAIWSFRITKHEGKYVVFAKNVSCFVNSGWKYFNDLKSCKTFADEYIIEYQKTPYSGGKGIME